MEYNIEVVPAIHSNLIFFFKECDPVEEIFLYHGLWQGFAMKDRSENILLRIPLIMINIPTWLKG